MKFSSWNEVLAAASTGIVPIYYQAPFDRFPSRLGFSTRFKVIGKKIRITPPKSQADPFTADAGHLDRFSWTNITGIGR